MEIALSPRDGARIYDWPEPPPDIYPDEDPYMPDEPADEATLLDRLVYDEKRKLRVRDRARVEYAAEQAGDLLPFDAGTLAEVLARPAAPPSRVEGLIPWEASTLLTAQRKCGKTTTVLNLTRSLLTGQDFLGRFGVRPIDGTVALLNFEVTGAQLARWADEHGIAQDQLYLVNLRGRRNPLGDAADRARLAAMLRERSTETIICDPFGRAYTGANQNDAGEVTQFLTGLDTFVRGDVGARDLILTAHAGWNGERTRGSTALEDWADSIITLVKPDGEDGDGERYLKAIGRDVEVDEDRLVYDHESRTLTLSGQGGRTKASTDKRVANLSTTVLSTVVATPGITGYGVEKALRDAGVEFRKKDATDALHKLVADGVVVATPGARGAKCYSEASTSSHLLPPTPGPCQ